MKRFFIMMFAMLSVCMTAMAQNVEVLYFHGKQRCKTCMAIEKETKTVVQELKGKAKLSVIDISTPKGKKLAQKYKVSWSSLYIVSGKGKNEKAENMTRFAFSNALRNAEGFRKELKSRILNTNK